jgi:hypothetical protein
MQPISGDVRTTIAGARPSAAHHETGDDGTRHSGFHRGLCPVFRDQVATMKRLGVRGGTQPEEGRITGRSMSVTLGGWKQETLRLH